MEQEEEIDNQNTVVSGESEELTEQEADFLGTESETDAEILDEGEDKTSVRLPSGRAMYLNEVIPHTLKCHHKIILLSGAHECGKTSLLSDIYLSFQKAEFEDVSFAESHTLVGFELKVWSARTSSLRTTPKTIRTSISEPNYLHLKVYDENLKQEHNLLFCDISGEKFERAANSSQGCLDLDDIDWTEHFVLVVDGKKLSDLAERHYEVNRSKQLLSRLIATGKLNRNTLIQVVFSKSDLPAMSEPETLSFIDNAKKELTEILERANFNPAFFHTSAHNIYGDIDKPFDLQKLFYFWLRNSPKINSRVEEVNFSFGEREIDKFYSRNIQK